MATIRAAIEARARAVPVDVLEMAQITTSLWGSRSLKDRPDMAQDLVEIRAALEKVESLTPILKYASTSDMLAFVNGFDDLRRTLTKLLSLMAYEPTFPDTFGALTERQREIMAFLRGASTSLKELAACVDRDESRVHRDHLKPLLKKGLVENDRAVGGYYRPDAPPAGG